MAQIKIYGHKTHLANNAHSLSIAIHEAVIEALEYPPEKKFHRFIPMESDWFIYPDDRSECYTIIEISMFEGRSAEAKKKLIRLLIKYMKEHADVDPQDVEITIFETPMTNWGIRGVPAEELSLGYKVDV